MKQEIQYKEKIIPYELIKSPIKNMYIYVREGRVTVKVPHRLNAILLKVMPNKVRIKDIKYAWGSCSSNRNITISKKLAKKEEKVIEYVVLHEMCHLRYMNHSKEFWNLVESYLPEYKTYRALLN